MKGICALFVLSVLKYGEYSYRHIFMHIIMHFFTLKFIPPGFVTSRIVLC